MIKQPATVIAETETAYLLETLPKSACRRCAEGKGCGGGILAQAFANKTYQLSVAKNTRLNINELVFVGIQSSVLVRASLLLYLLPLIFMITLAVVASSLTNGEDLFTVPAAVLGLFTGALISRSLSNNYINDNASPVLLNDEKIDCFIID